VQINNVQMCNISEQEKTFLWYLCQELTYAEIAVKMYRSKRTIDNYRESLFNKLGCRSKVGLVIFAIRTKIFEIK
jgi:two-component system, NarL family, invasion response regulator UvrY